MVFKAFESGIFSRLKQSHQSEQSEQSISDDKYTSLKLDNNLSTSNNASHISLSSDSDTSLFTPKKGAGLKILTSKQMLQRSALAQVKAGNNSETLLSEIRKVVYSLYKSNEITKKVYNNIIKLI